MKYSIILAALVSISFASSISFTSHSHGEAPSDISKGIKPTGSVSGGAFPTGSGFHNFAGHAAASGSGGHAAGTGHHSRHTGSARRTKSADASKSADATIAARQLSSDLSTPTHDPSHKPSDFPSGTGGFAHPTGTFTEGSAQPSGHLHAHDGKRPSGAALGSGGFKPSGSISGLPPSGSGTPPSTTDAPAVLAARQEPSSAGDFSFSLPTGSLSFPIPTGSGSPFSLPLGTGASGFALPTAGAGSNPFGQGFAHASAHHSHSQVSGAGSAKPTGSFGDSRQNGEGFAYPFSATKSGDFGIGKSSGFKTSVVKATGTGTAA